MKGLLSIIPLYKARRIDLNTQLSCSSLIIISYYKNLSNRHFLRQKLETMSVEIFIHNNTMYRQKI